ncbi:MAG: zf-HC2 domain-containing protein [Planctomycetota bacterium]|nr:zf-HC2 domain-containing protein [Planctomycetota bacterium]
MNCHSIEPLFSDLFDRRLPPGRRAKVERHLRACAGCRENYAAFERATSALRASASAPTEPSLAATMLAAVDRAASSEAMRPDQEFRRAMTLVQGDAAQRDRRRRVASMVGAMLGSAAAAVVVLQLSLGTLSTRTVEVVRQERVEVPVEVIREVQVGDGLLLEFDAEQLAAAFDRLGRRLVRASVTMAEALNPRPAMLADTSGRPAPTPARTLYDDYRGRATFEVRDEAGRIKVRSSGALTDLVPLLLSGMESPIGMVTDAASDRMAMIRNQLAADPLIAPHLVEPGSTPNQGPNSYLTADTTPGRWQTWWDANRQLITELQL